MLPMLETLQTIDTHFCLLHLALGNRFATLGELLEPKSAPVVLSQLVFATFVSLV